MEFLFEKIRAACDQPLSQATTLPREAYRSEEFHQWERKELLENGWLAVAHVSQIPLAGDFITLDLLDEPLVVVRGKDGVIRVLSRVCPHRAMDILPPGRAEGKLTTAEQREGLPESCGRTRFFLCPYHSWTFDLDGQLRACPEMQQAECFHLEDMEACPAVQRGLASRTYQPGRLSHLEMPVWLFHRYIAARARGVWPTEDRPPAPSQKGDLP